MRMALLAATLLACTPAIAQTTPPTGAPMPGGAANTGMAPGQPPPPVAGDAAGRAAAINANAPPVTPNPNPDAGLAAKPASGANSFTASQARARIAARGFTQVSNLHKDRKGVWWASAMHDGRKVQAWLDYKGNVGLK